MNFREILDGVGRVTKSSFGGGLDQKFLSLCFTLQI